MILKLNVALQLCDTFELFWKPEHCAERTMRAREEAGIEHVLPVLRPRHEDRLRAASRRGGVQGAKSSESL